MIEFLSGDLLQFDAQYIAQGVATGSQEGLGTGLALQISIKWPDVQQQFKKFTRSNAFSGGQIFTVAPTTYRPGVIYIATQPDMYHATINFLNKGLRNLAKHCDKHEIESVALPKIGAGLGKLDWRFDVKPLMIQHLSSCSTSFHVLEDYKEDHKLEDTLSA